MLCDVKKNTQIQNEKKNVYLIFFPGLRLDNIPSDMIRLTVQVSDSNQFEPASTDSATVEIAVIGKKENNAVNFKKK